MTKKKRVVNAWACADENGEIEWRGSYVSQLAIFTDVTHAIKRNPNIQEVTITLTPKRKKHKHRYNLHTLAEAERGEKYCRCGKRKKG